MRVLALLAAAIAAALALIGFVVAIQYSWGGPQDEFVGTLVAWFVAVVAILAAGAGVLAFVLPRVAAVAMLLIAAALVAAVAGSLGGWWSEFTNAFTSLSAMSDFASRAGSLLAIQGAVVALIVGAIFGIAGGGTAFPIRTDRRIPAA